MKDVDRQTAYRLIRLSITNLDIIRGAVRGKNDVFAKAICDRLAIDVRMLKDLIDQEK